MRSFLFAFLFLAGCSSGPATYDPVDWQGRPIQTAPQQTEPQQPQDETPEVVLNLLKLHNKEREAKGRAGLELDPYLVEYAKKHAEWMASKSNLKHSSIGALMGKYNTAGENIAWNQQDEEEVVDAWMHSSGHRANIMNRNFTRVGFAVAYNSKNQPYWCAVFGG